MSDPHQGSCHCGAVTLALRSEPVEATECNCSLCRRTAGLWHYCRRDELSVAGALAGYLQGDKSLTTWRCADCGCITHWTPVDPDYDRVGVNLRMFPPALWQELPRRAVDGASF